MESGAELKVTPVRGRRDLGRFIKLPFRLHRSRPQWVPPLIAERKRFLDRRRNPYFEHAEAEYFLAWRDGRPVGRITAQVDSRWDEFQGGNDGIFGFFECEDDPAAAQALVEMAQDWLRERGRERMIGPMDFTTNDECGLLVEGFEDPPTILCPWHPPYYRELLEGVGMEKAIDLLMWWLAFGDLAEGNEFHPMIHAAAKQSREEHGVTIQNVRKRNLEADFEALLDVYNEAWGSNWGFVPVTDAERRFHTKSMKPVLAEEWMMKAELDGEVVGGAITLPDANQVLAKMGGRLFPLGWLRFLLGRRKIDQVRVFALGVKPQCQHMGVAAALYVRHLENAASGYIDRGETGWILETNEPMNKAMEGMGGEIVKRYRIYETAL